MAGDEAHPDYESMLRSEYDTRFTADISNRMQMPDRLGAVSNSLDSFRSQAQSYTATNDLMHNIDPSYYMVGTPPRVLTAQDALYSDDEDDGLLKHYNDLNNGLIAKFAHIHSQNATPSKYKSGREDLEAAAVPMTPGSLLLAQSGDEMALIRRQLGKLISHVRRLEDENSRRQQREYFLYPLVLGFCLYQITKFFMGFK